MMWYDGGGGGWFVMTVFMVLFWALVIAGAIALVRYFATTRQSRPQGPPSPAEPGLGDRTAQDLLAARFARGEIDEDEYRRRLAVLREHA
ncbi:SHOCT domain-containing protein [Streptomyces fuscichromogenes]|uniref:SHOCT domain-containing protein n=1 Tax=Streptomyces fuscichromogenes TaxID=1324013 RepID=UPI0038198461